MKTQSCLALISLVVISNYSQAVERDSSYVRTYPISQPEQAGPPLSISGFLNLTSDTFDGIARYGNYSITLLSLETGNPIYGSSYTVTFNNDNSSFNQTHSAGDRWYLRLLQDPVDPGNPMTLDLNLAGLVDWSDPPSPSDHDLVPFNTLLPGYGFRYGFYSMNIQTEVDQIPAVLGIPEPQEWVLMLLGIPLVGLLGRFGKTTTAHMDSSEAA